MSADRDRETWEAEAREVRSITRPTRQVAADLLEAHGFGREPEDDDCRHEWTDWTDIGTCETRECILCGAEDDR